MSFGIKNGPPTYQRIVNKTFHEYIDSFMKIFLEDFIVFNSMEIHLDKLQLYFLKCHEFGISLNTKKCAFIVFVGFILRLIVFKEGKLLDSKNIL